MIKKIFLLIIILVQSILISFSLFIYFNKSNLERNVYLDFELTNNMKEDYKGKRKIHAFSADAYENFALYVPKEESNSLENAKFYGDIEKYNYLENNQTIDIWENDFNMAQIVVLMNEEFDSLSVELENEDKLDNSLKIEYGFNEFVYSSDYKLTNGMPNPFGIKQTLLVPEKVTNNKEIDKVYKNTVYIINVSVYSTLIKQSQVKELKFKIAGKKDGKTLIEKNSINLNMFSINYDNYKQSDYNLFYFPEWTSFYYNSVFVNKDSKKNYGRPDFIKDEYDFNEYIDFNWDLYWKNEYESLSKLGMDSFQLRMDDSWNSNWNDKRDFHNPWTIRRKSLNFIPWRYKGSFDTKNWKKELITFDEIKNGLEIKKEDWNSLDKYLNLLAQAGMKHGFINSTKTGWMKDNATLSIYDENRKEYFSVNASLDYKIGKEFMSWWFEEFKKHIDSSRPEWSNKIKLYYYLDEMNSGEVLATNDWLKQKDPEKKYLGYAFSDWERDIDYRNTNKYDHADYSWTHFLDIYNEKNKKYKEFLKFRDSKNLKSGEYFLDSDSTFNLTRSEPGIMGYIQAQLFKQGDAHYMKYILNGWEEGRSAWSSDFKDYPFVNISYISGDTVFTYPEYDTLKDKNTIQKIANNWKKNSEQASMKFNPSTRLLQLAVGTNNVNKINFLESKGFLSKKIIDNNINLTLKLGSKLSSTKFNLKYSDISFKNKIYSNKTNLEKYFLIQNNYDEIQGYKNIINNMKLSTRKYMENL